MYGEGDNIYTHMLDSVKHRNLALLKIVPDAEQKLGLNLFHDAMDKTYSFFGEVVWIPQNTVSRANGFADDCPLCHGLEQKITSAISTDVIFMFQILQIQCILNLHRTNQIFLW